MACLISVASVAPSALAATSIAVVGMKPHIETSNSSTTRQSSRGSRFADFVDRELVFAQRRALVFVVIEVGAGQDADRLLLVFQHGGDGAPDLLRVVVAMRAEADRDEREIAEEVLEKGQLHFQRVLARMRPRVLGEERRLRHQRVGERACRSATSPSGVRHAPSRLMAAKCPAPV